MPIQELKEIIANQKTVSTSRLDDIVNSLEKIYIKQSNKINNQRNDINRLNARITEFKKQARKRRQAMIDYENLKAHHRNLEREFNLLKDRQEGQA